MGPPSYMQSALDRNVVMWRMTVVNRSHKLTAEINQVKIFLNNPHYIQSLKTYLTENTARFH
jgi:hypothetical protein